MCIRDRIYTLFAKNSLAHIYFSHNCEDNAYNVQDLNKWYSRKEEKSEGKIFREKKIKRKKYKEEQERGEDANIECRNRRLSNCFFHDWEKRNRRLALRALFFSRWMYNPLYMYVTSVYKVSYLFFVCLNIFVLQFYGPSLSSFSLSLSLSLLFLSLLFYNWNSNQNSSLLIWCRLAELIYKILEWWEFK